MHASSTHRRTVAGFLAVVAAGLLLGSVGTTLAFFSDQESGTLSIGTGEVNIVETALDQQYAGLLPGQAEADGFSFENASTGAIDVYTWVTPGAGGLDYCAAAVAPFLEARLTTAADDEIQDWTSICNLVNGPDGTGADAPLLVAANVPVDEVRDLVLSVRLREEAGNDLADLQSSGDEIVLYAVQTGAPAPAGEGAAIARVDPPAAP